MSAAFGGGSFNIGAALAAGQTAAYEITQTSNNSDMGDIREDAHIESIAKLMKSIDSSMWGLALAETVKLLGIALAAYADEIQGRDPLSPTLDAVAS